MDELVIGEKKYVSSKKAAEITGYAKDYVGQLCREGYVEAKMVGRSWYVLETSIREHRFGAASAQKEVKSEEMGGNKTEGTEDTEDTKENTAKSPVLDWQRPTYAAEEPTPMPRMPSVEAPGEQPTAVQGHSGAFSKDQSDRGYDNDTNAFENEDEALSDMQSAWKEWFAQKRSNGDASLEDRVNKNEDQGEGQAEDDSDDYKPEVQSEDEGNTQKYEEKYTDIGNSSEEEDESLATADNDPNGFEIPIQRQKDAPVEEYSFQDRESDSSETQTQKAVQIPLRRMRPHEEGIIHEERIVPPSEVRSRKGRGNTKSKVVRSSKTQSSLLTRSVLIAVALLVIAVALIGSGNVSVVSNPVVDYLAGTSSVKK